MEELEIPNNYNQPSKKTLETLETDSLYINDNKEFLFDSDDFIICENKIINLDDSSSKGNIIDISNYLSLESISTMVLQVLTSKFSDFFINSGDILVIDTKQQFSDKARVLVSMDGNLSIKIFRIIDSTYYLQTTDKKFLPLSLTPYFRYSILGTITGIIHKTTQ